VDDWEHYLRVDPQGEWSDEARQRLEVVKGKEKQHEQSSSEPLLSPTQIIRGVSKNDEMREKINRRIEEYLDLAIAKWLPEAYPLAQTSGSDVDSRGALAILSEVAIQEHGDRWLADLLASSSSSRTFAQAVRQLSAALKSNDTGDNVSARYHATEAEHLFASDRNDAGTLRSRVEYMFASQDAQDGKDCLKAARGLAPRLQVHRYPWLQTQFLIEMGNCTWILGDLGDVQKLFVQAAQQAELAHYDVIYLRSQDHLSLLAGELGDLTSAWARNQKALRRYWSGVYPAMRGYNLYYNRYEFADSAGQPHLQTVALRDGIALTESFEDNLLRAMAHVLMANAAARSEQPQMAEREFDRASKLFAASPQIESTKIALLEAETRMAGVEISQGDSKSAINRLRQRESEIRQHPTNYLSILYYSTLGEAETEVGHTREADAALRVAVTLANSRLHSLHDDKSRIEWIQQSSSAYRNLVQQQILQGDAQGALEIWESYREADLHGGAFQPVNSSSFPQLNEVAARIPRLSKETIVTYAALPRGVAVWVYDDRGVSSTWIEGDSRQLRAQVQRFRTLCADPSSALSDVQRNARALYSILIAPIEQRLSVDRVLVVDADDQVAEIPY
jgi:hypothetical protein